MSSLSMRYNEQLKQERDSISGILFKVQDDLKNLRESLDSQVTSGNTVDISNLQSALNQIESTIVERTEAVVKAKFSKLVTLPFATSEIKPPQAKERHRTRSLPPLPSLFNSPGQEAQLQYISKLLSQPSHPATRQVLSDAFGIPVSSFERERKKERKIKGTIISGSTVHKSKTQHTPMPPITSRDAQKGILNLCERGLIPKSADIVLNPAPVKPQTLTLNKFSKDILKVPPMDNTKGGGLWTGIKFDYSGYSRIPLPSIPDTNSTHSNKYNAKIEPTPGATVTVQTLNILPELPDEEANRKKEEEEMIGCDFSTKSVNACCKLVVRGGQLIENKEYTSYKEQIEEPETWDMVQRIIELIEEMAQNYAIPVIFINAEKALLLGEEYDLEPRPSNKELLKCILNSRDVAHLLTSPGRRYKGIGGLQAAITKIQATYRMFVERKKYLTYRRRKYASSAIALGWTLHVKAKTMKLKLRDIADRQVYNYRTRLVELGKEWERFHEKKRVIIHVPSKGYLAPIRRGTFQFAISQNFQLSRIFDVIDPNVQVIYILPIELGDDVKDYYKGLIINALGLKDGNEAWNRIHFILPESRKSFGDHVLSLSSYLRYSPLALRQIKNIIGGYRAVMIPHVPYQEDMAIGDHLNIPVLCSDPGSVRLYTSFAGRRLLFSSAKVPTPPHIAGIRSNDQLIESLAWLIVNFPLIRRWLFKLDYYTHGKGIGYCDVADHLDCHGWIIKEKRRYGHEKWKKQWAQETARQRVLRQLNDIIHTHSVPCSAFDSWALFLNEFLSYGGSIEGCPPSDNVTSLTTDILLAPNSTYGILCTWDHIHSDLFKVWGGSIPQSSVDNEELKTIINNIATACLSRGLVGHLSIDYVTFIDPDTMSQVVWAIDVDFGPSDVLYMNRLKEAMTCASVKDSHEYKWSHYGGIEEERGGRYAVASTQLYHKNLSLIEYGVFFQMCKAHLIGYNDRTFTGTLFGLIEGQRKHNLSIICIQPTLKAALMGSSRTLSVIHQEVDSTEQEKENKSELIKVSENINKIIEQLES